MEPKNAFQIMLKCAFNQVLASSLFVGGGGGGTVMVPPYNLWGKIVGEKKLFF